MFVATKAGKPKSNQTFSTVLKIDSKHPFQHIFGFSEAFVFAFHDIYDHLGGDQW